MKTRSMLLPILVLCAMLGGAGCNGSESDIRHQYGAIDLDLCTDNSAKLMAMETSDFTLDCAMDPGSVFLFNSKSNFLNEQGRDTGDQKVMLKGELNTRLARACGSGDTFGTVIQSITVQGDTATVEILRSQKHVIMSVHYTCKDDWKKGTDGVWKWAAEHVEKVDIGGDR